VPIVPIIVDGTRDILPKKSKNINFQARIFVKVLDPIDPANFSGPGEMRDFVRKQMIEALSALRSSNDSKAKQNLSSAV
jgi:1-acyl-sn-glycerol-3-phosphate acyltransferase